MWGECPSAPQIASQLDALPLTQASRTQRFGLPVPESLYTRSISKPGMPMPSRDGKIIQGALLLPVPIEKWWQVINDDDHHAEGGYLPLLASEVIKGSPGGSGRETFQYYKSFGIGRWWVNRLEVNEQLYRMSDGALWELRWRDAMADYPGDEPPVEIDSDVAPIDEDWGAWLLISLGESCTLVEYVASGEPGVTVWERSDVTAIGAATVIVEAMLALVLGDALLFKLGGDAIGDVDNAWKALAARLAPWWRPRQQ